MAPSAGRKPPLGGGQVPDVVSAKIAALQASTRRAVQGVALPLVWLLSAGVGFDEPWQHGACFESNRTNSTRIRVRPLRCPRCSSLGVAGADGNANTPSTCARTQARGLIAPAGSQVASTAPAAAAGRPVGGAPTVLRAVVVPAYLSVEELAECDAGRAGCWICMHACMLTTGLAACMQAHSRISSIGPAAICTRNPTPAPAPVCAPHPEQPARPQPQQPHACCLRYTSLTATAWALLLHQLSLQPRGRGGPNSTRAASSRDMQSPTVQTLWLSAVRAHGPVRRVTTPTTVHQAPVYVYACMRPAVCSQAPPSCCTS